MVVRTRLIVRLYVYCLCCCLRNGVDAYNMYEAMYCVLFYDFISYSCLSLVSVDE